MDSSHPAIKSEIGKIQEFARRKLTFLLYVCVSHLFLFSNYREKEAEK